MTEPSASRSLGSGTSTSEPLEDIILKTLQDPYESSTKKVSFS